MDRQPHDFAPYKLMAELSGRYHLAGAAGEKWLSYHLQHFPPTTFGGSLLKALAVCEEHLPSLGFRLVEEIASVPFHGKRDEYEQIIQKLAEVLILRVLLEGAWPAGTQFLHEPRASNGRRPELVVDTPDQLFLFEAKCPSLIRHQFQRAANAAQIPARLASRDLARALSGDLPKDNVTWPKDNTIRDYLESAQSKFVGFRRCKPAFAALVVLWDSFMYEAISPLVQAQSGLFTNSSWHKDKDGRRIPFEAVDGVLILHHLDVLVAATREEAPLHRRDPFSLRDRPPQRNVWCRNVGGKPLPETVRTIFDAEPVETLSHLAEYLPLEAVFWTTVRE